MLVFKKVKHNANSYLSLWQSSGLCPGRVFQTGKCFSRRSRHSINTCARYTNLWVHAYFSHILLLLSFSLFSCFAYFIFISPSIIKTLALVTQNFCRCIFLSYSYLFTYLCFLLEVLNKHLHQNTKLLCFDIFQQRVEQKLIRTVDWENVLICISIHIIHIHALVFIFLFEFDLMRFEYHDGQ